MDILINRTLYTVSLDRAGRRTQDGRSKGERFPLWANVADESVPFRNVYQIVCEPRHPTPPPSEIQ